ncbi:hypothetical protein ES703_52292 [subsurface metagenome]
MDQEFGNIVHVVITGRMEHWMRKQEQAEYLFYAGIGQVMRTVTGKHSPIEMRMDYMTPMNR